MRGAKTWTAIMLGTLGCGAGDDAGSCVEQRGIYEASYEEIEGTCGQQPQSRIPIGVASDGGRSCVATIAFSSADRCTRDYSTVCDHERGSASVTGNGTWSGDGRTGVAVESWSIAAPSGEPLCKSRYRVTFVRAD